jgi:hypothetical protein
MNGPALATEVDGFSVYNPSEPLGDGHAQAVFLVEPVSAAASQVEECDRTAGTAYG